MQRRAAVKYHAPGLWSNTCCGHPAPGGASTLRRLQRLQQEISSLSLTELGSFRYFHQFSETSFEHEFDHVLEGFTAMKIFALIQKKLISIAG